ncbi:acetyl-CoA hydrolase/transferase C-terminal domain-containing protein [Reinekea blandensis]|uniref:Acetyl-CoA hydrolase n=1 Tax=Reinekea blandensis MED297 TaxID=314283 RepID=A4BC21_9GAMM|nr:acetyl-CoA hydrolase/transferase C-terminal domain-containing protein [Reinekea blandensis]EAR10506.1 Acetyl-CoA hydrolase [Reinekea sp. MED297] [Reinekea blandensis MED297]
MNKSFTPSADTDLNSLAQSLFDALDGHIVMGVPIGIGKATHLINALYGVAKNNPTYSLEIQTALSLGRPPLKSDLEKRLLTPFFERQFQGVPELDYVLDGRKGRIPDNIRIVEFYFKPGEMLHNPKAQQNALSANYTHVARDIVTRGVNLVTQMISKRTDGDQVRYSLSCNPDVTLDLQPMMKAQSEKDGKPRFMIAQVNEQLPFMPNDAEVSAEFFDHIVDQPDLYSPIFATPQQPISPTDHMIGLYTSALVKDAGTLQIGIGSLGDAVVNALRVRHQHNAEYRRLFDTQSALERFPVLQTDGDLHTFEEGLYGNTEMLVSGYMELIKGDILKRRVYDDLAIQTLINQGLKADAISREWIIALREMNRLQSPLTTEDVEWLKHWGIFQSHVTLQDQQLHAHDQQCSANPDSAEVLAWLEEHALATHLNHARLIHAGFFVGNAHFYEDLRRMDDEQLNEINMTTVSYTNQLLGDEALKLAQRKHARFINACMKMTLSGAAVSDGLADGKVVSGVGGQFNFVSMALDTPDARSILMMRSTKFKGNKVVSNIVFNYAHATVPRHMRDIVVTEYGVADLRAKNDEEIVDALLKITDSRFQAGLIREAKKAGKLPKHYRLPKWATQNTPEKVQATLSGQAATFFPPFPFGKELTDEEVAIGGALKRLKHKLSAVWPLIPALLTPIKDSHIQANLPYLKRMGLEQPNNIREKVFRRLLLSQLPVKETTSASNART